MKNITAAVVLAMLVAPGLGGCLLEDRNVQIVLGGDYCMELTEYETTEEFTSSAVLMLGSYIDDLLDDNGVSSESIDAVLLTGGSYEVTEVRGSESWVIGGVVTVERMDIAGVGPDTLMDYTGLSLDEALAAGKTTLPLHAAGVAVINGALDDYRAGVSPVLRLTIVNGDVEPSPSGGNPLDFTWITCLSLQVVATTEVEIVDPLGGS